MTQQTEKLPNWVTDLKTPQELIDQVYNSYLPMDQRYFKPPETPGEQASYSKRLALWWQVQLGLDLKKESNL